ncbi:hypothetical protein E2C01_024225 [Portunus trituberculatus]|uniref:Uncharacterized protein n=1 Tax=Portunus trituberculatus TaxID=210409 RepID=A0A5B7ED95_PORTR|nr:hypothetical protein [Portunus trituberculatus]
MRRGITHSAGYATGCKRGRLLTLSMWRRNTAEQWRGGTLLLTPDAPHCCQNSGIIKHPCCSCGTEIIVNLSALKPSGYQDAARPPPGGRPAALPAAYSRGVGGKLLKYRRAGQRSESTCLCGHLELISQGRHRYQPAIHHCTLPRGREGRPATLAAAVSLRSLKAPTGN